MPSPKSGSAGSAVEPAAPEDAVDADDANPGKVAQAAKAKQAKQDGTNNAAPAKYHTPAQSQQQDDADDESEEEEKTSWIEIELLDEEDQPVAGEKYEIELPDGSIARGTLDQNGFARVEGIDPGTCKVTFPELDKDAWEKA